MPRDQRNLAAIRRVGLAICLAVVSVATVDAAPKKAPSRTPAEPRVLKGIDALHALYGQRDYAKAEDYAYHMLFEDIWQPEALDILVRCLNARGKIDDAGVYNTLLLRVLEEGDSKADVAKYTKTAVNRQKTLDRQFERLKAQYAESAKGKHFGSPEQVGDLWMTQVKCDLSTLHGRYAWKLVGGRKDAKPDWIHNAQGVMHRSGMKYMDSVDGRKGVLFGPNASLDAPGVVKAGHLPRVTITNLGGGRFLRLGMKGYNWPCTLKVSGGDQELLSQVVGAKEWSDLKVDLKGATGAGKEITLELGVPTGQKPHEGVWFDYIDFFDD
jgi:hypothetical protein